MAASAMMPGSTSSTDELSDDELERLFFERQAQKVAQKRAAGGDADLLQRSLDDMQQAAKRFKDDFTLRTLEEPARPKLLELLDSFAIRDEADGDSELAALGRALRARLGTPPPASSSDAALPVRSRSFMLLRAGSLDGVLLQPPAELAFRTFKNDTEWCDFLAAVKRRETTAVGVCPFPYTRGGALKWSDPGSAACEFWFDQGASYQPADQRYVIIHVHYSGSWKEFEHHAAWRDSDGNVQTRVWEPLGKRSRDNPYPIRELYEARYNPAFKFVTSINARHSMAATGLQDAAEAFFGVSKEPSAKNAVVRPLKPAQGDFGRGRTWEWRGDPRGTVGNPRGRPTAPMRCCRRARTCG